MDLKKLSSLLANNDIVLAIGLVIIVCMMVIPLPAPLLDALLTINISLAFACGCNSSCLFVYKRASGLFFVSDSTAYCNIIQAGAKR